MSNPHANKAALIIFFIFILVGCTKEKTNKEVNDFSSLCSDIAVIHFKNKSKQAEEINFHQNQDHDKCLELKKSLTVEQEKYYTCPPISKIHVPSVIAINEACLSFFLGIRSRGLYY